MEIRRRNVFQMIAGAMGFGVAAKAATAAQGDSELAANEAFPASERFKLLYQRIGRAEGDAERKEMSLAGCSMAAMGATNPEHVCAPDQWAWHPAYHDVLDLRRKFDASLHILEQYLPIGRLIVLYPCGCSFSDDVEHGKEIPVCCAEHDPEKNLSSSYSMVCGGQAFVGFMIPGPTRGGNYRTFSK